MSTEYYHQRAKEYETIYQKPERQTDLSQLHLLLEKTFPNQRILEIACGTGYWTQTLAKSANHIFATDINEAVLEIAKAKTYTKASVNLQAIDLNKLPLPSPPFDGIFGGFIWSHILNQDLDNFINLCLDQIKPKGQFVFIDNKYVEGNSTPISRRDKFGNTFQNRELQSGATFEVLKNFPKAADMKLFFEDKCNDFEWIELEYYWMIKGVKRET